MNLYRVTNLRDGNVYESKGDDKPEYQKEWGPLAGQKYTFEIDEWEKINGHDLDGNGKYWVFPDSFTIDVINIDADTAITDKLKIEFQERIERLRAVNFEKLPDENREIFRDIITEVIRVSGL